MDNPEKLTTYSTQDEDKKNKTQHTMCWTPQKKTTNNVTPATLNIYFHAIPICMRNWGQFLFLAFDLTYLKLHKHWTYDAWETYCTNSRVEDRRYNAKQNNKKQ